MIWTLLKCCQPSSFKLCPQLGKVWQRKFQPHVEANPQYYRHRRDKHSILWFINTKNLLRQINIPLATPLTGLDIIYQSLKLKLKGKKIKKKLQTKKFWHFGHEILAFWPWPWASSSTLRHNKAATGVFMANKLVHPPIPSFHVVPARPRITKMREIPATHSWCNISNSSGFRPSYTIKVAEHSSNVVGDGKDTEEDEEQSNLRTVAQVKADLFEATQGVPTSYSRSLSLSLFFFFLLFIYFLVPFFKFLEEHWHGNARYGLCSKVE